MEYPDENYISIVDTLLNTFGEVLSRDVLYSIVESFGGDRKYIIIQRWAKKCYVRKAM